MPKKIEFNNMNKKEINKIKKSIEEVVIQHNKLEGYGKLFKILFLDELEDAFNYLTPRERIILKKRFGLEDGITHTLEEISKEFDVYRERIKKIETNTLEKIKHFIIN